jgi:hypothetical protein
MRIFTILVILISSATTFGQNNDDEIAENIKNSTNHYGELFMSQNFEELSNFASPKLIEFLESKQDFIYLLTQLTKNAETQGITVIDISFGNHSELINHGNELQIVIPFEIRLENDEKLVEIGSGLALVSFDKGKSWHFTFQVKKDKDENNRVLGLNENINIPSRTQNVTAK